MILMMVACLKFCLNEAKKAAGNIRFFVSCHLQCDIVESCYGGACGDNRNTAEDAQKIQKKTGSATRPMNTKNLLSMLKKRFI